MRLQSTVTDFDRMVGCTLRRVWPRTADVRNRPIPYPEPWKTSANAEHPYPILLTDLSAFPTCDRSYQHTQGSDLCQVKHYLARNAHMPSKTVTEIGCPLARVRPRYIHVISAGFEPMIESVRH